MALQKSNTRYKCAQDESRKQRTSTPEFCHLPALVIVPRDEIVSYLRRSDYMFLNLIPCK